MDPNLQLVLNEFCRRFDDHDAKWECRFAKIEAARAAIDASVELHLADLESIRVEPLHSECDTHVAALEAAVTDLGVRRPEAEGTVDDLRLEVSKLAKHWDRAVVDTSSY